MNEDQEPSTDLVRYEPARHVDLRNAVTDSWTDVLESVADLANKIANTDFVPESYRGAPGQVAATILHGREVGFGPMTALATTHSIKGKPSISAEAMRALVLQAGHDIVVVESSGSRVVMKGRRRGTEEWTTVAWTLDDVRKANIRNPNYSTYPRQMLAARCTAELCRLLFPDVIHGLRAAEELVDDLDQVVDHAPAVPVKTTTVQRKRAAKKPTKTGEPGRTAGADDPAPLNTPPARKRAPMPEPKTNPANDAGEGDRPTNPPADRSATRQQDDDRQGPPDPTASEPAGDDHHIDEPDDDIVDAEIVTGRPTGPKITNGQNSAIMMHWARLSLMQDREERLLLTNTLLGYEPGTITTNGDLRGPEAIALLKILETLKDRDALDQRLAGQDQLIHEEGDEQ